MGSAWPRVQAAALLDYHPMTSSRQKMKHSILNHQTSEHQPTGLEIFEHCHQARLRREGSFICRFWSCMEFMPGTCSVLVMIVGKLTFILHVQGFIAVGEALTPKLAHLWRDGGCAESAFTHRAQWAAPLVHRIPAEQHCLT